MEKIKPKADFSLFFAAFCRGDFHGGNVLTGTFPPYKTKTVKPNLISGGETNKYTFKNKQSLVLRIVFIANYNMYFLSFSVSFNLKFFVAKKP
jgi:hypothetical protein